MGNSRFNNPLDIKPKTGLSIDNDLLRIENLNTGYILSRSKIVSLHNDINITVGEGELIAVLGPNGAGKSTLLKSLTAIIPAINGNIYYNGTELNKLSRKEVARLVAIVLTYKIEDRYLTAYDIVGTGRYPYGSFTGKLTSEDKEKIGNAFEAVGAEELTNRVFYSLSDGEKQKIMLARAIAQDTPLILLDEPTAYIDSPGKVVIINLLKELVVRYNKTILLTTHDTELALVYADKLWLMGKENYFQEGKPDEMIDSGLINQLFDREGVVFNKRNKRFETKNNF